MEIPKPPSHWFFFKIRTSVAYPRIMILNCRIMQVPPMWIASTIDEGETQDSGKMAMRYGPYRMESHNGMRIRPKHTERFSAVPVPSVPSAAASRGLV